MTLRKPLAQRRECLPISVIFGIERFIVLDVIEGLVERQKRDNDLRRRFEESEA
jgi:uncharacterized membrane protein